MGDASREKAFKFGKFGLDSMMYALMDVCADGRRVREAPVARSYFVMKTSLRGNVSKTAGSWVKLVARMSTGFPAIHWERSIVW